MQPLLAGDPTTLGRYRLLGRIGAGGMGAVYLAETPGRVRVALKVIHPHLAADHTFRTRFAREVISTRRVEGLCTARVLDADVDGPIPYLVTEFIDGPSLAEEVRAHGPLTGERLDALAAGLAEALTAIHGVGLVHRDLKPANVLLATAGPKVIDFGIAALLDDTAMTASGVVVGTPTWLAPEQLLDQPVTPALDVFMWGSVVTFAGTANPPFATSSPEAYGARVLQAEPNLAGLPAQLAALVTRALAKDPRSRPTARQLLSTLAGGAADGTTAQATRLLNGWTHCRTRKPRWWRRQPAELRVRRGGAVDGWQPVPRRRSRSSPPVSWSESPPQAGSR